MSGVDALAWLDRLEWAASGCAYAADQWPECPVCGGLPESMRRRVERENAARPTHGDWTGYTIGHDEDCDLAVALAALRRKPRGK